MSERLFLTEFLNLACRQLPESYFLDEFTLVHDGGDDYDRPTRFQGDLVEIDGQGRVHLWQFVPLRAPDLVTGALIGRMFAFTRVLRITSPARFHARFEAAARRRRYDTSTPHFHRLAARPRQEVESWNVVVCGGTGCELVGSDDNLLYQLYAPLDEWVGPVRDVNTWQFRRTATGFDLRSLWDVAAYGRLPVTERLEILTGRRAPPAPDDDFDIACKRDLRLKRRKGLHAEGYEALFGVGHNAVAG